MQILVRLGASPEAYVREKLHARIKAPACCPNCRNSSRLRALGYYERGIASTGSPAYLRFFVRRFRCMSCKRTTSVLPDFSQPYRLISNQIIGLYFRGGLVEVPQQWSLLLNRYWRRFADCLPLLSLKIREDFKSEISLNSPDTSWSGIEKVFGGITTATKELTDKSGITLFGVYQCHQPYCFSQRIMMLHTTIQLHSGKDPPH